MLCFDLPENRRLYIQCLSVHHTCILLSFPPGNNSIFELILRFLYAVKSWVLPVPIGYFSTLSGLEKRWRFWRVGWPERNSSHCLKSVIRVWWVVYTRHTLSHTYWKWPSGHQVRLVFICYYLCLSVCLSQHRQVVDSLQWKVKLSPECSFSHLLLYISKLLCI